MNAAIDQTPVGQLPALGELGNDLLQVTSWRRFITLATPFVAMGLYALFAWLAYWPLAIAAVMMLSFVTYGSTSHDLVHRTLHMSHRWNDFLLSLIELLSLRSGTAYRLSHLNHHQHLLEQDDIEGATAHGSLIGAISSGILLQPRLWLWAWRKHPMGRKRLAIEAVGVMSLALTSVILLRWTPAPLVYVGLVIGGSWLFPLVTVYIPHDAIGKDTLIHTRLFRGWLVRFIAFEHLYHLEHHLYPAVPHHHWKRLADRLDPHLMRLGIFPVGHKQ